MGHPDLLWAHRSGPPASLSWDGSSRNQRWASPDGEFDLRSLIQKSGCAAWDRKSKSPPCRTNRDKDGAASHLSAAPKGWASPHLRILGLSSGQEVKFPAPSTSSGQALSQRTRQGWGNLKSKVFWKGWASPPTNTTADVFNLTLHDAIITWRWYGRRHLNAESWGRRAVCRASTYV